MTSKEAYDIALKYMRLNIRNFYIFIAVGLAFGGWTVLTSDVNETEAYADLRKVMAVGYTLISVSLLMVTIKYMVRSNAAVKLAGELLQGEPASERAQSLSIFKPTSILWALFAMTAIIIVVNYIVLIYAVDGGLF